MATKRRTRVLQALGAVVVVLVVSVGAIGYATFSGLAPVEDGRRVGATVEIVKDGYVTAAILDLGEGHVALVDCGDDRAGAAILAALARRDLGPDDVQAILLTHGHPDHTGGCHLFRHASIYGMAADAGLAAGTEGAHSPVGHLVSPSPTGTRIDHPLEGGETLTLGDAEVRAFAVPGHTAGSAAYLVDGVLFVGDSASVTTEHTLRGAPWFFTDDTAQNIASMHALGAELTEARETVHALVCAHSGVLSSDDADVLGALRAM